MILAGTKLWNLNGSCISSTETQKNNTMKTIIKTLFTLCLLTMANAQAQGNHGEIHGKVTEEETGNPLPGAAVFVEVGDRKIGTTADDKGRFILKPLDPGKYNLHVKFSMKEEYKLLSVVVNPNKITFIPEIKLVDKGALTTVVIITYKDPIINPEDPTITTIRAKEFMATPLAKDARGFIGTLPGFQMTPNREIHVRGGRAGDMVVFFDGVKMSGGIPNFPSAAVSSISSYPGGIPAKYGDVTGGVIVIETKSYFEMRNERMNR